MRATCLVSISSPDEGRDVDVLEVHSTARGVIYYGTRLWEKCTIMRVRMANPGIVVWDSKKEKEERNIASHKETLKKSMELLAKRDFDAALEFFTDDITTVVPILGTMTGKEAIKAGWQKVPAGFGLEWSEPTEEDGTLKTSASSPFGQLTMIATFSGDKISQVEIKMG
jgi:hypothetical protein